MTIKNILLSAFAMMAASTEKMTSSMTSKKTDELSVEDQVPKGCKTYYFSMDGTYTLTKPMKITPYYWCYAINEKNAIKKFKKFKKL